MRDPRNWVARKTTDGAIARDLSNFLGRWIVITRKQLRYMEAALVQAPDEGSKTNLQAMITKLKDGQNVN